MARTTIARWRASIHRRLVVALAVAPCFSSALLAQDRARQTLILGDLYSQVNRASPRIQAAQAAARAAEARVAGVRVPPDPQLQLAFMNYSPSNLRPMDPIGMPQLQLMQMIPVAGKLSLAGRVAQTQSDAAWSRAAGAAGPTPPSALLDPDMTGSIMPYREKEESRPPVAEGWRLRDFYSGRAVVESRNGMLFEVGPGSNLPGLGRVESIKRENGRVVVVARNGVITASSEPRRPPAPIPYRY